MVHLESGTRRLAAMHDRKVSVSCVQRDDGVSTLWIREVGSSEALFFKNEDQFQLFDDAGPAIVQWLGRLGPKTDGQSPWEGNIPL